MPVSNPVIRRYTPPTCTLEVMAQSSELSSRMGKSVLKQLNFELRFDDPRLPEERRIAIKGDRDQLEALYSAVTNYVQEFLQKSPESFWASFSEPKDSTKVSEHPELKGFKQILPEQTLKSSKSFNNFQIPEADIHLEPSNYLIHNLFLGSLANHISGGIIQLSLLQLFDLATALDEYSAEVIALPTLNKTRSTFSLPSWIPVAAVVLVALGLTPFTWQYANNIRQKQQTAKKAASTQELALQPSPSALLPTPQPGLTPPDNLLVPPLGTTPVVPGSTLPTPPAAGSTLPPTPIPGSTLPATSQLPVSAKIAPGSFPSIPQTAPGSTFSTAPLPSSGSALTIPGTTAPTLSRSSAKIGTTKLSDPFAIPTNSQQSSRIGSIPKNGIALPNKTSLPSNLPPATTNISSGISAASAPLATGTNARGTNNDISASSPTDPSLGKTDNSLADRLKQGSDTPSAVATGTLFDTPQIAEARDFLKKRWQPPTGLKQTLEYSLLIGVDGKVERILPLGKAARDYVDTTGMPGIGQPFVSPNRNGQNVRIRAVLSPDGKVQIFPESQ